MARADRLERLENRRIELEAEYVDALRSALQATASGTWGLFDHTSDRARRAAVAPVIEQLAELGDAIDDARERLGLAPFELQQRFLSDRGPVGPEAVGEPKQAQAWLERLALEASSPTG